MDLWKLDHGLELDFNLDPSGTSWYIVHQADWRLHISWFYFKLMRTPAGLCVTSFGFLQFK